MKVRRCDQEYTVTISGNKSAAIENLVNMKTLENCFNKRNDREMGNINDTVDKSTQNTNLTADDTLINLKIELARRSKKVSSGRDATSVMVKSQRGEHMGITAPLETIHYSC